MTKKTVGIEKLTPKEIKRAKPGSVLTDGGGLRVVIRQDSAWFTYRQVVDGKYINRGLGTSDTSRSVSAIAQDLKLARTQAASLREGEVSAPSRLAASKPALGPAPTLEMVFGIFWEHHARTLRNAKHKAQWRTTLDNTGLMGKQVREITAANIADALRTSWRETPETASRTLQRLGMVFDEALGRDLIEASPIPKARMLLRSQKRGPVKHHAALDWREAPAFWASVETMPVKLVTRLALQFLILTAARSGEVRGATWSEIDLEARLWTIPAPRMKAGVDHVVPLCAQAVAVLERARELAGKNPQQLVFVGRWGKQLSDMSLTMPLRRTGLGVTAHGFRSTFRDWCAEHDKTRGEVAESALAHTVRDKVTAAYKRTTYLDERHGLMQRWADYLRRA